MFQLLPEFLKSIKSESPSSSLENDDSFVNQPKLRRSWRLCNKKNTQPVTVSGYFEKLLTEGKSSKSIFKEIRRRYEDDNFEERLFKQLKDNFLVRDSSYYKQKLREQVEDINRKLIETCRKMSGNRKRTYTDDDKENYPMKFPYLPQSKWVFQTPPNRKLNFRNLNNTESSLKPAVIENHSKIIYEMNKKINIDLSKFNSKEEVDIDKRFMVQVSNNDNFLPPEPFELENHFLSLTCRPKKVTSSVSRVSNMIKKRDIFLDEPQPSCSNDTTFDFKPHFIESTELNEMEESFTFKFTNSEGSTTGHLFDVEGNQKNTFNFHF